MLEYHLDHLRVQPCHYQLVIIGEIFRRSTVSSRTESKYLNNFVTVVLMTRPTISLGLILLVAGSGEVEEEEVVVVGEEGEEEEEEEEGEQAVGVNKGMKCY